MKYTISYEANPTHEDLQKISEGITDNAQKQRGFSPIETFAFFIRDDHHQAKGGCTGLIYYGCLHIGQLWIDEHLRNQDYGTALMQKAEKFGKEKNCQFVTVSTMDWEALGFYQKLGFHLEFERHGYPKNSVFCYLRKAL